MADTVERIMESFEKIMRPQFDAMQYDIQQVRQDFLTLREEVRRNRSLVQYAADRLRKLADTLEEAEAQFSKSEKLQ